MANAAVARARSRSEAELGQRAHDQASAGRAGSAPGWAPRPPRSPPPRRRRRRSASPPAPRTAAGRRRAAPPPAGTGSGSGLLRRHVVRADRDGERDAGCGSTASMIGRSEEVTSACGIPAARTSASSSRAPGSSGHPRARLSSATMPSTSHRADRPRGWPGARGPGQQVRQTVCVSEPPTSACWSAGLHGAAQPGHDRALGLEPERLGVHQQPVHVEQDGSAAVRMQAQPPASGAACQVLKYFASGWCAISASVDCSGAQLELLRQLTPIRSGSSSRTTLARSSRSGQAG